MSKTFVHYRLLTFPVEETPAGGLLDALHQESRRGGTDLLFDYHALRYAFPPELFERGGRPWEHVRGEYVPRRLRFTNIKLLDGKNIGASLADLPPQDPERSLYAVLGWRNLDGINTYRIDLFRVEAGTLMLEAGDCRAEAFPGPRWKADFERNWSPVPLSPARLIPAALPLHCRFGGDPITVRLKGQSRRLRLFVGGLDTQSSDRPDVQAVLNLSEKPSLWALHQPPEPPDRWVQKGYDAVRQTLIKSIHSVLTPP